MIDTDYGHSKLRILELQTRWQVTHKVGDAPQSL